MDSATRSGPAWGLITSSEVAVTAAHLDALPGLAVVGRAAAGTENIDIAGAARRGVAVLHVPEATAPAAAELTIGLIVSLLRRVPVVSARLRSGVWAKELLGEEVAGKTLGIIGLGRVGSRVSRLARALGMRVVATDPYIAPGRFRAAGAVRARLDRLLAVSHVVTVHTPLTRGTRGLLSARRIARMRRGAYLVNCARGGIVDERALRDALADGRLSGAAIDTWAREPGGDPALLALESVLGTPHVGAATVEARERMARMITDSVVRFLAGDRVRGRLA
jgi:D-3-phosphoglycerate dehydrogenase